MASQAKTLGHISYSGKTLCLLKDEKECTLLTNEKIAVDDILITFNQISTKPIDVDTPEEMERIRINGNVGGIFKYTGITTGTYVKNNIYILRNNLE